MQLRKSSVTSLIHFPEAMNIEFEYYPTLRYSNWIVLYIHDNIAKILLAEFDTVITS